MQAESTNKLYKYIERQAATLKCFQNYIPYSRFNDLSIFFQQPKISPNRQIPSIQKMQQLFRKISNLWQSIFNLCGPQQQLQPNIHQFQHLKKQLSQTLIELNSLLQQSELYTPFLKNQLQKHIADQTSILVNNFEAFNFKKDMIQVSKAKKLILKQLGKFNIVVKKSKVEESIEAVEVEQKSQQKLQFTFGVKRANLIKQQYKQQQQLIPGIGKSKLKQSEYLLNTKIVEYLRFQANKKRKLKKYSENIMLYLKTQ